MNFLFLMDPLHSVMMEKDTSFIIMLGAHKRGHKVFFLPDGGITRDGAQTRFHAVEVIPQQIKEKPFIEVKSLTLTETDVDVIFVRSDPPFDGEYLLNTWLLDLISDRIALINRPSGIRTVNEKIWATQFSSVIPKTLIARNRKDLIAFLHEQKDVVAKPTDGHGGKAVFHIRENDPNANVILETLTDYWKKEILLQTYLACAQKGDKRILLLNGEPLGAVLRVHSQDDHRNNFFAGGKPAAVEITANDRRIIEILKPKLLELGLYFVGIDVIGDYLIEVNVTSPTCLQEMNALYNTHLQDRVVDFAESLVRKIRAK
jgi:glutathione synthase